MSLKPVFAILIVFVLSLMPLPAQAQRGEQMLQEKRDLASVLGEAHYIRTLCNGQKDQYWRNFMSQMLDLEGGVEYRRSLLVRAFNLGYRTQSRRSSGVCNSQSPVEESKLATRGRKLAERIALGYLN